ncbi:MAG: hypothetical protein E7616_09645 [Ruminococcaceae bacterium]|nr:hypothetical protein [Oscillospiraceae bacterium]
MKITGSIVDTVVDLQGGYRLTLRVNEKQAFLHGLDEIRGKDCLSIEIKPYRPKRSNDANSYCWVLLDLLAEKLSIRKESIYKELIREIGGNCDTVCVREISVEKLRQGWKKNGIGWVSDVLPSKIPGCKNVILYYGSSTYDSAQMSRLIDLVVDECKQHGIETMTPMQIALLKEAWKGNDT